MAAPLFQISTVNLEADASRAHVDLGTCPRGECSAEALVALLTRFAALDAIQNSDAEPQVLVTSRRGRFAIRMGLGKLFVYETRDASRTYVELLPADIPRYLEHGIGSDAPMEADDPALAEALAAAAAQKPSRAGLALLLMALGLGAATVSATLSLRTEPIDSQADYTDFPDRTQVTALRAQSTGTYVMVENAHTQVLVIHGDGTVRYTDTAPDGSIPDDVTLSSTLVLLSGSTPVLRTEIGPIEFHAPDTLVFAREAYQRKR
jgi:hypothetical protein